MEWDPQKNKDVISLVRQEDGNWKGFAQVHDKYIEVREGSPNDCLNRIITHV